MPDVGAWSVLLGVAAGAASGYVTARLTFRNELASRLDETLGKDRACAYRELWPLLKPLARYDRPGPLTSDKLQAVSQDLAGWYFEADRGIYLSDDANDEYMNLKKILAQAVTRADDNIDALAEEAVVAASRLRHEMRRDLGGGNRLLFRRRRPRDLQG